MTKGDIKIAVTMLPDVALYIHEVTALIIDFTFKRVKGDIDELEVVGYSERFKRRLPLATLYCNRKTVEAYYQLFTELMDAIRVVTGEPFKIHPFHPNAKCRAICADGEAAQAQGLGRWLVVYNDATLSGILSRDPDVLVQYILRTCILHFYRRIDGLPKSIPQEVTDRLKSFPSLKNQAAIDEWHEYCKSSSYPEILAWYQHKISYPWFLPSLNAVLTRMDQASWIITPDHTNYVESAHAGRNANTDINIPILMAILKARDSDRKKASEIRVILNEAIMPRRWNLPVHREDRAMQRKNHANRQAQIKDKYLKEFNELSVNAQQLKEQIELSMARSKKLKIEVADLSSRNSSIAMSFGTKRSQSQRASLRYKKHTYLGLDSLKHDQQLPKPTLQILPNLHHSQSQDLQPLLPQLSRNCSLFPTSTITLMRNP
ncbi:hypothetical protein BXZ70DRAFT_945163 [Cristinia sonorae]|uniref:Uncharacterized protein n=1 Tax=Cristinia sonorae TaxID=1940300 RepID=A0A8K0UL47_9AGAR|nr:hypothetical protein BXZ70DRAFT_945163 [Cristinia sonorae]